MRSILQAFGGLVCGVTRRHVWNYRKYKAMNERICSRCGIMKAVRRKLKENPGV